MQLIFDTNRIPGSTVVRDMASNMMGIIAKLKAGQESEGKKYLYVNNSQSGPAAIFGETYDEVKNKVIDQFKEQ